MLRMFRHTIFKMCVHHLCGHGFQRQHLDGTSSKQYAFHAELFPPAAGSVALYVLYTGHRCCNFGQRTAVLHAMSFVEYLPPVIFLYTRLVSKSAPTWSSRWCFTACHFYFGESSGRNAIRLEPNSKRAQLETSPIGNEPCVCIYIYICIDR